MARIRRACALALGVSVALAPILASAQRRPSPAQPPALGAPARPAPPASRQNPYLGLFQPRSLTSPTLRRALQAARSAASGPRVVCGMTIVPADPAVDPAMVKASPAEDVRFTIRAVPPPLCR